MCVPFQDLLTVMGIPSPGRGHLHRANVLKQLSQSSVPPAPSERDLKSLSGNGMHIAVVGVLLACIIKNIEHV